MSEEIRELWEKAEPGDPGAADDLLPAVYRELRLLAAAKMAQESAAATLQPTALVHEAWLRLGADRQPRWQNRRHFFGAAAEAMRRILIDRARQRQAVRRGEGRRPLNIDDLEIVSEANDAVLLSVNEALEGLARHDPAKAELVKLRYFAGFDFEEAARALEISVPTAKRWWAYSRAWLHDAMRRE